MSGKVIQGRFVSGQPRTTTLAQAKTTPRPPGRPVPTFASAHVAQPHAPGNVFPVDPTRLGLGATPGRSLPDAVRARMEAALDADFSDVRVHVGPQAERIGAIAFTVGTDIYFAPGRFQPDTTQGRQLLGHELAHVVQQRQGRVRNPMGAGVAVVQDLALEAEADRLGHRAATHQAQPAVQRKPAAPATQMRSMTAQADGLLGEGKLSPSERRQRVFMVMWNGVVDLRRRLDLKAARGELPSLAEVREFDDLMAWGRAEGLASVAASLGRHEAAVRRLETIAFERGRAVHQAELTRLREGRGVRTLLGPRRTPYVPPRRVTVRVGVVFRIDGRGEAHSGHDMPGIRAINRLNELGLPLHFAVEPVPLPEHASGSDIPERLADTPENLPHFRNELRQIDVLYIPGAPAAITAQVATTHDDAEEADFNRAKPGLAAREAASRGSYELGLIMAARAMGVPLLAICAGTWRLVQAYGGEVRTLPRAERELHKSVSTKAADVWGLKHDIGIEPNTLLHDLVGALDLPEGNSTHWAVVAETARPGELRHHGGPRLPSSDDRHPRYGSRHHGADVPPSELLRISARTSGADHERTVEAIETRFGTPHLGIQWHPETYLPGMPGYGDASGTHRLASARLFRGVVESGRTRQRHRAVVAELAALSSPDIPDIQRALGLHSIADARAVYLEIAESLGSRPTREEIRLYLSMFSVHL